MATRDTNTLLSLQRLHKKQIDLLQELAAFQDAQIADMEAKRVNTLQDLALAQTDLSIVEDELGLTEHPGKNVPSPHPAVYTAKDRFEA